MSDDLRELVRGLSEKVTRMSVHVEANTDFRKKAIGWLWKVGAAAIGVLLYMLFEGAGIPLP